MNTDARKGIWPRFRQSAAGRWCVRFARLIIDGCVERYFNIRTGGSTSERARGHFRDSNHYEPLDYPFLFKCIRAMELKEDDVVYEIGCGMGRVVCVLARRRVARCVGIELSDELAARARQNVASMRGRKSPVDVHALDATFADYSDGTAFYIFNSFGPTTLAAVLDRIRDTLRQNPRLIRVLYVNPIHEDVLESARWLRRSRQLRSKWFRMQASLWTYEADPVAVVEEAAPELQFCCDVPSVAQSSTYSSGGRRDGR
jgi:precorrin-6B methylase 2